MCKKLNFRSPMALAVAAMFALTQLAGAATTYVWNITNNANWSAPASWTPATSAAGPLAIDSASFGNNDTSTTNYIVNNTVDSLYGGTVSNLTINSSALPAAQNYDVTQIPSGTTLTVLGNMVVGGVNGPNTAATTEAYFTGGGTLAVLGTNLVVQNWDNTTRNGATAWLNLSALTNFVYYNTNHGTISIMDSYGGSSGTSGGQNTGFGGNMALAAVSNSITAVNLSIATSQEPQIGPAGFLVLGSGTNKFNVSNFNLVVGKSSFTLSNAAAGSGLRIRGLSGADSDASDNITIADRNQGGTATSTGSMLLNGCDVDIKAGSLIVAENIGGSPTSLADGGTGLLQFDTGTISANSLLMAYNTSANNGTSLTETANCTGTVDVGSHATLLIGAGQVFALATAQQNGPSTGILIISNGLMNCQGPLTMGTNGGGINGSILLTGGTLNMGANSYVGTLARPVTTLTLTNNCTLSLSIPATTYTNICVQNLNWPTPDTGMTISLAAVPIGINPGTSVPFLSYSTVMNGTFNNPILSLPAGVQGNLSQTGNTIYLTLTGGVGPGQGGQQTLLNPSFEQTPSGTGWTTVGGTSVITTNTGVNYPNTGPCTFNALPIQAYSGTNVAKLTGSFVSGGSTNSWSQSVAVTNGSTFTAGGYTYVSHDDIMSGADSFYYEVDFKDTNGVLLSCYESPIVTNLTCGETLPFAVDAWNLMAVTNQMQVIGGINTGVVLATNIGVIITAPPHTVTALFKAVFIQRNATDTGSVYLDAVNLGFAASAVGPTLSTVSPNLVTLCTNTSMTCTANSTETTISSVQLVATTTTLGGSATNVVTYTNGSPGTTVSGIGTSNATITVALATNTIYQSVVVSATDADGLSVASPADSFDTLTYNLVIEGSDFNFTNGLFLDTPANGGLALYTNKVGNAGVDENKAAKSSTQSYYRPLDAVITQPAAASTGVPPTGTEQKFVTALANGDTNDVEVEVGFNSVGDWLNYTRTFTNGPGASAPGGTYNIWCYLATSGSGVQLSLSQVTNSPTMTGQLTNFIGTFGTPSFSDASYNSYVYVPLVDQFGNRIAITLTNVETLKSTIVGNPNIAFYMLEPVQPILTPILLNIYPNAPFQSTSQFTFTVSPAQGSSILTSGIGLTLNGVPITSGLSFVAGGAGSWTVNYAIQSNELYTAVINVTNSTGGTLSYSESFDTFNINNFHWMAVDYDFSTNNGTSSGGSVGNGWTGGLFIDNPAPTGDTNILANENAESNSYYAYPMNIPETDPVTAPGAVAQQSIDIQWGTNTVQDPGLVISNSVYRFSSQFSVIYMSEPNNVGDGVGSQLASDTFLLPEFIAERTNTVWGNPVTGLPAANDPTISEFNVGYFYATNWLNYTRTYPTGTFNVWGRLADGGTAFSGCTLSQVTSGVGTSNQTTQVLGTFADSNPAGWQTYHWIPLLDTNGNSVYLTLNGKATLRLSAPAGATSAGDSLNPLFFMLVPAVAPASAFDISALISGSNIQISIPTQNGHNYTVWYANSVTNPLVSWTQVGGTITGNGSVQVVSQSVTGNTQGFYQVKAQ
jgi:hypothetical protein